MSAPMTAERIAELSEWYPFDSTSGDYHYDQVPLGQSPGAAWHEMLGEIERLRGLVARAHRYNGIGRCACGWQGPDCFDPPPGFWQRHHAAHVDALIPGWRP